jgi:hypothetical protein
MPDEKLVLHPSNPWAILHDPSLLLDPLRSSGLIGVSVQWYGEIHYAAGPRFHELVQSRSALPDLPGVHVSLAETTAEPEFLGASNTRPPLCPRCRTFVPDWMAQLQGWRREGRRRPWSCSRCRQAVDVGELDWTHSGGVARYSLDLWGIRHGAAIPSAELLNLLERTTFERWNYFYYRLGLDPTAGAQPRARL